MKISNQLKTLTVVIPCLNEEKNVEEAIQRSLDAFDIYQIDGELIVINDGSNDSTEEAIISMMKLDKRIFYIGHKCAHGIGRCFMEGVQKAKKDVITMMPGDNEGDPLHIFSYINLLNAVDIVVPFVMNVEVRSKWRRTLSSTFRFIINMSFGTNLNYTNGPVLYNHSIIRELSIKSTGFLYQAELLVKLIRAGYFYAEVPILSGKRGDGLSKALTLKSFFNITKGYLGLMRDIHLFRISGSTDAKLSSNSVTYTYLKNQNE